MPQPVQFQRIAERYGIAGSLTQGTVPEAAAFAAYHAFESIGCAWIRRHNRRVPRRHDSKINLFITLSRHESFAHAASYLGILTNALRNKMLYPVPDGSGGYILPETVMSSANAVDLLRRVGGIVRRVTSRL